MRAKKIKKVIKNYIMIMLFLFLLLQAGCTNPMGNDSKIGEDFHPGITISLEKSVVSVSAPTVQSGGTVILSAQINDQNGTPFTNPVAVSFSTSGGTSTGSIGSVTSLGNGLYTATFSAVFPGSALTVAASAKSEAVTGPLPILTVTTGPLTITDVSPTSTFLEGGKTLTINGTGFVSGLTVTIGGSTCTSVAVPSATQLTCVNAMHNVGPVNVQLDRYDAATATLTNSFTYSSTLFATVDLVNGALSTHGSNNGVGTTARFFAPVDIVESGGILYVSDTRNNLIRQINITTGVVSDLAGVRGPSGSTNGLGGVATFSGPTGMAIAGGYLYVSDTDNCSIRRIDLVTTQVTTWAGTSGSCQPSADGSVGSNIKFVHPWGLTTDGTYLYVVDSQDAALSLTANLIRKIDFATVTVTTIAGNGSCDSTDSTGTAAGFCAPVGIALVGTNLFISENFWLKIRKIDMSVNPANVTTFAGPNTNSTGASIDGVGAAARFGKTGDIVSDGTYLYVADTGNNTIRKIEISTKTVTTVAGTAGTFGFLNGTGTAAKLYRPGGMALVGTKIYFTDMGNDAIRIFDIVTGIVTAFAGYGG